MVYITQLWTRQPKQEPVKVDFKTNTDEEDEELEVIEKTTSLYLPLHTLLGACSFLELCDILSVRLVCKSLNQLIEHSNLYDQMALCKMMQQYPLTNEEMRGKLSSRFSPLFVIESIIQTVSWFNEITLASLFISVLAGLGAHTAITPLVGGVQYAFEGIKDWKVNRVRAKIDYRGENFLQGNQENKQLHNDANLSVHLHAVENSNTAIFEHQGIRLEHSISINLFSKKAKIALTIKAAKNAVRDFETIEWTVYRSDKYTAFVINFLKKKALENQVKVSSIDEEVVQFLAKHYFSLNLHREFIIQHYLGFLNKSNIKSIKFATQALIKSLE